jgi:hypothetical protein
MGQSLLGRNALRLLRLVGNPSCNATPIAPGAQMRSSPCATRRQKAHSADGRSITAVAKSRQGRRPALKTQLIIPGSRPAIALGSAGLIYSDEHPPTCAAKIVAALAQHSVAGERGRMVRATRLVLSAEIIYVLWASARKEISLSVRTTHLLAGPVSAGPDASRPTSLEDLSLTTT